MAKIDYAQTTAAKKGRNGDKYTAHIAAGEVIVPPVISPELRARLYAEMEAAGIPVDEYIVGDGMSINPETDMPEFGFGKFLKKVKKIAIPVAAAYFAPGVGSALSSGLGLGLGTASSAALGGAALGGLGGALTGGGLSGALQGAALGGLGGYLGNGGFNDLGITGEGSLLGSAAGGNLQGPTLSGSPLNEVFQGSGALGAITSPLASAGAATGGGSSFSGLAPLISTGLGLSANEDAQDELLKAQQQQLSTLQPFTQETFNPGDLTQDPGYQFLLDQGQNSIAARNAAAGGFYSGAALKDAVDYSKNLADTTYNNAYQRWAQNQQQKYGAARDVASIYGTGGTVGANTAINNSNLLSRGLAGLLGGSAFGASGQTLGGNDQLLRQLLGYA